MKKVFLIGITCIALLTVAGCFNKGNEDSQKFKDEYESINNKVNEKTGKKNRELTIPKNNPFVYKTSGDINKMIDNKESFVIYFGFNDCPWCRSVLEELISSAKDNNVETIYYVDVKDIRDVKELDENGEVKTTKEGDKDYLELVNKIGDVLEEYTLTNDNEEEISVGEKRIYAPNVVAISKGKAIQLETGISDDLKDPYGKLTDKMKKYSYNKFKCLFECLEEDSNTCQKNSC